MSELYAILKFRCSECGDLHDDEDVARECCMPRIDEVWCCPICEEPAYNEREALHCCDGIEQEVIEPLPYKIPPGDFPGPAQYIAKFCELNRLTR